MRWRRLALFQGFVGACAYVEEEAAAAGEDVAAAVLDWFGVSVRAAEIPAVLARMRVLARKVQPLADGLCFPFPACWSKSGDPGRSA